MIKLFVMNYSPRSDNYVVVSDLRIDGSLRANHLCAVNISQKKLLLLHIIYNEAEILATIGGNQSDITCGGKTLLFLTNPQTAFLSEAPVLASLSPVSEPAGMCSLEKHGTGTEERRNQAGNCRENSPFADEH